MEIIPLNKWIPNLKVPLIMAGPCSAESEEQMLITARALAENKDVRIFRAGIWKPRTRPNCFEGVGEQGLKWLQMVKQETGLLTSTEVANPEHVELALKYGVDILWIGARTSANPFSVQAIADSLKGTNIPIFIKNPVNADVNLWLGAIERIAGAGINKIGAIHRGFTTGENYKYRNRPHWEIPIKLKKLLPNIPMICDPSHLAGRRDAILEVSQKAMDLDIDGLMIETHPNPDKALSDAGQQITPLELERILLKLKLRSEYSASGQLEESLEEHRVQIDEIDRELIELLLSRKKIVEKIAAIKKEQNITPLQIHRMKALMENRLEQAEKIGLTPEYVEELFEVIHTNSVKLQSQIINDFESDQIQQ